MCVPSKPSTQVRRFSFKSFAFRQDLGLKFEQGWGNELILVAQITFHHSPGYLRWTNAESQLQDAVWQLLRREHQLQGQSWGSKICFGYKVMTDMFVRIWYQAIRLNEEAWQKYLRMLLHLKRIKLENWNFSWKKTFFRRSCHPALQLWLCAQNLTSSTKIDVQCQNML